MLKKPGLIMHSLSNNFILRFRIVLPPPPKKIGCAELQTAQSIALNFFCTCLIVVVELNVGPPSPPAALPGAEPPVTTVSPSRGVAGGRGGRWATSQAPVRLITRAASGGRRSFGPEGSAVKHDRIRIRIRKHQINQFHFN